MKDHNYYGTFIQVADDSPVTAAEVPKLCALEWLHAHSRTTAQPAIAGLMRKELPHV
ncbi:DUF6157 family protein [Paenibacillus tarimensis]|uniref:DUF6157 family protein n=1 Tax=Paenibacillus tarimensis TaxID=416012 RepID=UPI001F271894|nr:DUF6157 family protein [Paenibacillus tarimensis]MCF2945246.1 DUF6157 family protein [Paenibacillus tarimensis]